MVLITEEGFFRGWLWPAVKRTGKSDRQTLILTNVALVLGHVSAVSFNTGFDIPSHEPPISLINISILGLI
jgi:hypothetical protein